MRNSSTVKAALQKDEAFLAGLAAAPVASDRFSLCWLGQSGFLLKWKDRQLLFDPYLSDSLTTKYADTDKPHVRMTELVIDPARLDSIDLVTSSHNHTDHLDGETLAALMSANPELTLLVSAANQDFVAVLSPLGGVKVRGFDRTQTQWNN